MMSLGSKYPPPTPTKQVATPWVRDDKFGVLSLEIRAVEIFAVSPHEELAKLRLRLANSEHPAALRAVRDAADALVERAGDDLKRDFLGLLERCKAKLTRAQPS
jgi:hypothetical protein